MVECKDTIGNILKIGDKVKCLFNPYHNTEFENLFTINKCYLIKKIENNEVTLVNNLRNYDRLFSDWFIKVDCLKNKIRKLKRLLNK